MINCLENILAKMHFNNKSKLNISFLQDVKDYLEKSCEKDIVFYRITDSTESSRILSERLKQGRPGAVVFNKFPKVEIDHAYAVVTEKDFFCLQKKICNMIYPDNLEGNKIVGITGTNGKTSVCHFLSEFLANLGYSTLSIGTLGVVLRTRSEHKTLKECGLTTPSYLYLRELLFKYKGCFDFVVMELSSHGLAQDRLGDIKIDLGIWTNFTQDHLDYHETMERYFLAKSKIFHCLKPYSKVLIHKENNEILERLDDYCLSRAVLFENPDSDSCKMESNTLFFKGFILKNIAAAFFAVKELLNVKNDCWDFLTLPLGRFNIIEKGQKIVVVDYAHTPDALKNLIGLAKAYFVDKKINVLFGCGGERDKGKRSRMGEVAQAHANKIYITSDNPRCEDPSEILNHVKVLLKKPFSEDIDRRKMIKIAIDEMKEDEVLLVVGKGHERFQEIQGVKYPFDDSAIVKEYL